MGWIWSSLYSKAILAPVFRYWSELEYLSILSELWELFNLQLVVSRLLKWLSVIFTCIIPSHWVLEDPMTIMTHVITLFYLAKGEPDLIKQAFKKKRFLWRSQRKKSTVWKDWFMFLVQCLDIYGGGQIWY